MKQITAIKYSLQIAVAVTIFKIYDTNTQEVRSSIITLLQFSIVIMNYNINFQMLNYLLINGNGVHPDMLHI